jgi:hypothetical protein
MLPNPYADYEKDGFNQLLKLCKAMCRIVQSWETVIRAKYGDNENIINLLDLTLELCALLPAADAAYQAENLVTTPPDATSEETAGYDPSAPEAVPPDFT